MTKTLPIYQFHKYISEAYSTTQTWLQTVPEAKAYKQLNYTDVKEKLSDKTMLSAASQYNVFFPTHYFKVIHTLDEVIGQNTLVAWLNRNPRICIIDIGCGSGAGSSAFLDSLLRLQETKQINNDVEVFCLGIDPNLYAVGIYAKFMEHIKNKLSLSKINLAFEFNPEGIPNTTGWVIDQLNQKRDEWKLPNLAHVIVMQANVVSPLNKVHDDRLKKQEALKSMGIKTSTLNNKFGSEEALAYKSIFESVAIDNLHIVTIATDNYMLNERVEEMGNSLKEVFSKNRHKVEILSEESQSISFTNHADSYWGYNKKPYSPKPFHLNVTSFANDELRGDKDWHEVIDEDNLKLAWVKTRQGLLKEAFFDELEIRLFEQNLDQNIIHMQQQLMAYAENVARDDDYVAYKVPKNQTYARPRGLSRMQEELLSVAIIQKLGNNASQLHGNSFAYRVAPKSRGRDTEYLYAPWFNAYKDYIEKARSEAKKQGIGAIIRVDIKSFYTRIIQDQLLKAVEQLIKSKRIEWLLKLLLSKNLDQHEVGRGIVQGSLGSGFYANVYLTAIDRFFGNNNDWGVKLFRYVDDMIFVVPKSEDGKPISEVVQEIKESLVKQLILLGLELNEDKTEIYYDIDQFLQQTETDSKIKQTAEDYEKLTNSLWILDSNHRANFINYLENDELWWHYIQQYHQCLQILKFYTMPTFISRQIHKYLFNQPRRNKDLKQGKELIIPQLPTKNEDKEFQVWRQDFTINNSKWIDEKERLTDDVYNLLWHSWQKIQLSSSLTPGETKRLETRIRFSINKLSILGFGKYVKLVIEILLENTWVIHKPLPIIESLAKQSFSSEILEVFKHYEETTHPMNKYMRAITLRSMRFLPNIKENHWNLIVKYAKIGSLIERLMSTETWLYLNNSAGFYNQKQQVEWIRALLTYNPTLRKRLRKNYYLLLKEYNPEYTYNINLDEDDIILKSAKDVDITKGTFELLGYQEPNLIRQKFYSGRREDDADYAYPT